MQLEAQLRASIYNCSHLLDEAGEARDGEMFLGCLVTSHSSE